MGKTRFSMDGVRAVQWSIHNHLSGYVLFCHECQQELRPRMPYFTMAMETAEGSIVGPFNFCLACADIVKSETARAVRTEVTTGRVNRPCRFINCNEKLPRIRKLDLFSNHTAAI
jgi:hypothetical protein